MKRLQNEAALFGFFNKSTNKGTGEIYGKVCSNIRLLTLVERALTTNEKTGEGEGCKNPMKIGPVHHFITSLAVAALPTGHNRRAGLVSHSQFYCCSLSEV